MSLGGHSSCTSQTGNIREERAYRERALEGFVLEPSAEYESLNECKENTPCWGKTHLKGKEEMKLELTLGRNISCSQQPKWNTS